MPALVTSYDRCSDTHTLLSDDLGVHERPLADATLRLVEPCDHGLQDPAVYQHDRESHRSWMLADPPNTSDWGSSSVRAVVRTPVPVDHQQQQQQQQTPGPDCPAHTELFLQSASDDALLHSAQINGALPDACLLPETAHRISLQSSSSAADLCIQAPVLWETKEEPTDLSFDCSAADQHMAAGVSTVDYPPQYHFGEPLSDDLDLERLWADEL